MKVFIMSEDSFEYHLYTDARIADVEIEDELYERFYRIRSEWVAIHKEIRNIDMRNNNEY